MTAWNLTGVLLLVAANAFFVAAEFGLVAVRRTRIEELAVRGNRRAISARKAIKELNLMLSGSQLGITLASLGLGWIGEPALAHLLEGVFDFLPSPLDAIATHGTAVIIAFAVITFLHVVLGELVPKNVAIAKPEGTALWIATPMRAFTYAFRPVIWLFNETANLFMRLVGMKPQAELSSLHTPEELAIIIEESRRGGAIQAGQSELLTATLEFPEKRAVEAMVPRIAARSVHGDAGVEQVLDLTERTGFSRFPVWGDRPDEFVGWVHLKDILRASRRDPQVKVKDVMREPLLVPESLLLQKVLIQMRRRPAHFAIVLDEFGSTSGIITLEDILEELVGEIRDEYDLRELRLHEVKGGYRIPGIMRPDELAKAIGIELPEGNYETVAGFILERLGRLARRGDEVLADGWTIRVVSVRRRRILSVDVLRSQPLQAG
ncbi:MAG: hemolysin family protein [Actinomycetota bacterium]